MQRWRLSHGRRAVCKGPRGRPPSPWLGRRPRRKRQAVTEAMPGGAARPGRGANPAAVPQSYNRCRARPCYPLAHLRRRSMPRQDEAGTRGPNVSAWPCHIGSQAGARPGSFYSLACASCTIAWARRTYLLSARSRTVLTPSVSSRAWASLLDRPKAVSGASTSAANFLGPDSASEGGVVSDLSGKASRCWLGVRPAHAHQGRRLAAGHCWEARAWWRVVTRSAVRPGPAPGHRRRRR
jgi:hypothetical protein